MDQNSLEQTLAIGSAVVALVSFLFNWAVVARQTAMQRESLKAQMDADVLHWAHEAIDAIAEADALARGRGAVFGEDELKRQIVTLRGRLSALADRGRLFFPNLGAAKAAPTKESAFTGSRPPVLDAVIFALYELERLDPRNLGPDDAACAFLNRCRRLLVSEIQGSIDPRRRGAMLRKLGAAGSRIDGGSSFRFAKDLSDDLRGRFPGIDVAARDETWVMEMEKRARHG